MLARVSRFLSFLFQRACFEGEQIILESLRQESEEYFCCRRENGPDFSLGLSQNRNLDGDSGSLPDF